ncbi:MAG TPA: hypothetical protein VFZ60_06080 [Nitrososphaeraceae archaeon]
MGDATWTIQNVAYAIGIGLCIPGVLALFLFIVSRINLRGGDPLSYGYWSDSWK